MSAAPIKYCVNCGDEMPPWGQRSTLLTIEDTSGYFCSPVCAIQHAVRCVKQADAAIARSKEAK